MQSLQSRLREYREQHLECTSGQGMPGPYVVVRIEDKAAGIGNELPGIITGMPGPASISTVAALRAWVLGMANMTEPSAAVGRPVACEYAQLGGALHKLKACAADRPVMRCPRCCGAACLVLCMLPNVIPCLAG